MSDPIKKIENIITEPRNKAALIGALVFGLLSQGMGLFNVYSCHDDAGMLFTYGETYTLGRWLTHIIERLSVYIGLNGDGVISLTLPNGIFLLLCAATSACLVNHALDISDRYLSAFVGGLMLCVPTVTCYMGYRYNAVQFGLALLLAATGAYLACGTLDIRRFIAAFILLGCSAGAYQGFIPFAICVILFRCIREEILSGEEHRADVSARDSVARRIIRYASRIVVIVLGTLFYAIANHLYLALNHYEMIPYRGIDKVSDVGGSDYVLRVLIAYKQFLIPTRESLFYIYPSNIRYIYYLAGIICLVLSVRILIYVFKHSALSGILLMIMLATVPLACNFMIVMAGVDYMYSTMTYAQMMPFVLTAMVIDMSLDVKSPVRISALKYTGSLRCILVAMLMLLNLMYVRYDNKLYMIADFTQQECISYFTTLVTRITSLDGYRTDMPVVYINENDKNPAGIAGFSAVPSYKGVWGQLEDVNVDPYWTADVLISNYAWKDFMNDWCGYHPDLIDPAEYANLSEVIAMPHYPDAGSIQIIDDTIIVNF